MLNILNWVKAKNSKKTDISNSKNDEVAIKTNKKRRKFTTQMDIVLDILDEKGYISRNEAIFNHNILRLSAIIYDLKCMGYVFKSEKKGGDFIYHLVHKPSNPSPFNEVMKGA